MALGLSKLGIEVELGMRAKSSYFLLVGILTGNVDIIYTLERIPSQWRGVFFEYYYIRNATERILN